MPIVKVKGVAVRHKIGEYGQKLGIERNKRQKLRTKSKRGRQRSDLGIWAKNVGAIHDVA